MLALTVPMLATAAVVLAVTLLVERLGPRIGGVVAGLPIVIGPGLAFLALREGAGYVAAAAVFALVSLSATQVFVLAYAGAARRAGPWGALAAAVAAWAVAAWGLAALTGGAPGPWAALALFVVAVAVAERLLRALGGQEAAPARAGGRWPLVLRAVLAGVLVGAVTQGAARLGPQAAGLLLAYPIGMTVIAVTIHQRQGAGRVIATLRGAAVGMLSIAAFCVMVAVLAAPLGPLAAMVPALAVSLGVTAALFAAARRGLR